MRGRTTLVIAAVGAALALGATPAAAQYAPIPPGYASPSQGYAYGPYNTYNQAWAMKARIDGIQRQIHSLYHRRAITRDEYNGLRKEANRIESRIIRASRYGLNPSEARDIDVRIYRLERHVVREVRDGNRWDRRRRY